MGLRKTKVQENGESYIMLSYIFIVFFTEREKHRLRVFENKVLRKIFGA